jgi:DNA-binding CsgD family transcriptional regulator
MNRDAHLIDRIYEAGAISETWPDVLETISDRFKGTGGVLFAIAPEGTQRWVVSPKMRSRYEEFVRDGWVAINRRPQRLAALNYFGFVTDFDVFTQAEMDEDPVYTEFYAKRGMGWASGSMIPIPSGDMLVYSFERAFAKGPFEDFEVSALDALRPHLARAAMLSARLDLKAAKAMTATLQAIGLPGAVLKPGGQLYAANDMFQKLIPGVVRDRRERLALVNASADRLLADTLSRLKQGAAKGQSRSIPLAACEEHPAFVVHIVPVKGLANDVFARSLALLVVTPLDRKAVPNAEVLQGLFDLTPAEARVARGIAEGKTIEAVAAAAGLSRETIRSQLAATLGKTGLSRQVELAALLSGASFP